jgi:hypothetical protein
LAALAALVAAGAAILGRGAAAIGPALSNRVCGARSFVLCATRLGAPASLLRPVIVP